jgi:Coenzyme Q (ubiquinone) biosynthesis protein Coq4
VASTLRGGSQAAWRLSRGSGNCRKERTARSPSDYVAPSACREARAGAWDEIGGHPGFPTSRRRNARYAASVTVFRQLVPRFRPERNASRERPLAHRRRRHASRRGLSATSSPDSPRGSTPGGRRILEERPTIDSKNVDFDALRRLPDGTLGREYLRFLDDNGITPDVFEKPDISDARVAYVMQAFARRTTSGTSSPAAARSCAPVTWPRRATGSKRGV